MSNITPQDIAAMALSALCVNPLNLSAAELARNAARMDEVACQWCMDNGCPDCEVAA